MSTAITAMVIALAIVANICFFALATHFIWYIDMTKGQVFYYGGSGYQLAASTYSHYGFIPLRGAGTYRTKFQQSVHSSTGTRIGHHEDVVILILSKLIP